SALSVALGSLGLAGPGGGVTRANSTLKEPLCCPSFSRTRSAVSMELCRKPVVTVTTRTFLGLDAAMAAGGLAPRRRTKANRIAQKRQERFMSVVDNGS